MIVDLSRSSVAENEPTGCHPTAHLFPFQRGFCVPRSARVAGAEIARSDRDAPRMRALPEAVGREVDRSSPAGDGTTAARSVDLTLREQKA